MGYYGPYRGIKSTKVRSQIATFVVYFFSPIPIFSYILCLMGAPVLGVPLFMLNVVMINKNLQSRKKG